MDWIDGTILGVVLALGLFIWQRLAPEASAKRLLALVQHAKTFVDAAEQMAATGDMSKAEKLDWVTMQLKLHFPNVDEALIRAAIEQAVRHLPESGE